METVDDIVKEMLSAEKVRNVKNGRIGGLSLNRTMTTESVVASFSGRISEALGRERAQHAKVLHAQIDEVQRCAFIKDENATLRAALKPVLDFTPDKDKWWDQDLMHKSALRAISDAHRIYNESEGKK